MRALPFVICLALQAQDPAIRKEMAMGRQLAAEVRRSTTTVESQVIQDYVAQLGARVAAQLPDRGIPYTFSVVQGLWTTLREPRVLPGGDIFVPLELFTAANDEAEFAAMLTQAAARGARLVTGQGKGSIILLGNPMAEPSVPLSFLPRMRAIELEADATAVPALARAGFDPTALLRYIERMQTSKGTASQVFSTLPARDERIAALQEVLRTLPQITSTSSEAFKAIQDQVPAQLPRDVRPILKRR